MGYNGNINNRKKFAEITNKAMGLINQAGNVIADTTNTVVEGVKEYSNSKSKVRIVQDVISEIDNILINGTMKDSDFVLYITEYDCDEDGYISIESLVNKITASYDVSLREKLISEDYIAAIFAMIDVHYKTEDELDYILYKNTISIKVLN